MKTMNTVQRDRTPLHQQLAVQYRKVMDFERFVEGQAMLGCILRGGRDLAAE